MLYYGDGCFFPYLEGPRAEVGTLDGQLMKAPCHHVLSVLRRECIGSPSSAGGPVKYVPAAIGVQPLFYVYGKNCLDPHSLGNAPLDAMVSLLHHRNEGNGFHPMPTTSPCVSQLRLRHSTNWAIRSLTRSSPMRATSSLQSNWKASPGVNGQWHEGAAAGGAATPALGW